MIKNYILKVLNKLVLAERSVTKLTLSFCLGASLAFSPYVGVQTWLIFPLCWIFGLNVTVSIGALYLISNPFTMLPIILGDYMFGYWLVNFFNLQFLKQNPVWVAGAINFINKYFFDLEKALGADFCFWCFFLGAHILSITVFIVLYPIMKRLFKMILARTTHNQ